MKAVLDACVLYPTVMREILLRLAASGLYQPVWSARILEEWARAASRLGAPAQALARGEITLLRANWPQASVAPDAGLAAGLVLPDPDDVHVLATAIGAKADLIVTMNLKDFPRRYLAARHLRARHPDEFLRDLFDRAPGPVASAAQAVRAEAERLSAQHWPMRTLLKKARLPRLGKALDGHQ